MGDKIEFVLKEVLNSELDYINHLTLIVDVFKKPLQEKGIITSEQAKAIFGNVDDIKELNIREMKDPMEARFNECKDQGLPISTIALGDIFINLSSHLKSYTEYCANSPKAIALINQLNTSSDDFYSFDQGLMNNDPRVKGLPLNAYIVKPVQRLCKYPLLLRELISTTEPSSEEHQRLEVAFGKVSEAVAYVNEIQRQEEAKAQDKLNQIIQIETSIEGAEDLALSADANRSIVKMGEITRFVFKKKPYICTMILFNNFVIVSKPKDEKEKKKADKKKSYKPFILEFSVKLDQCSITDLADTLDQSIVNAFELRNKTTSVGITLCCNTAEEKRVWIKEIRLYIKDYQKMQATRLRNQNSQKNLTGSIDVTKTVGSVITSSWGVRQGSGSLPPQPKFGSTTDLSTLLKREEDDVQEDEAKELAQELLSSHASDPTHSPHSSNPMGHSHGSHGSHGSGESDSAAIQLSAPVRGATKNDDLFWACATGDIATARNVVAAGMDVNEANYDFRVPLHLAAVQGYMDIVKFLVEECGANAAARDRWGNSPANDAQNAGHSAVAQFLKFAEQTKTGRHSTEPDGKKKNPLSLGSLTIKKSVSALDVKMSATKSSPPPRTSNYSGGDPMTPNGGPSTPTSTSNPNLSTVAPSTSSPSLTSPLSLSMSNLHNDNPTPPPTSVTPELPVSPRRMTLAGSGKPSFPLGSPTVQRTVVPGVRAPGIGSVSGPMQAVRPLNTSTSVPPPAEVAPAPVTGNSRSGFLVRLAWNEDQKTMMWSAPIWCSVKNGFFFTFLNKDAAQPQSRVSILGKGTLPEKHTDIMMLDRIPKLKTDVFPFILKTSESAEPIFLAAPTSDSRHAWLQTIVNWVDGPKTVSNDPPPEDPAGNPTVAPGTPGTPGRAAMTRPMTASSGPSVTTLSSPSSHARTSSVGSSSPGMTPLGAGQNPMMQSRAYQAGIQWLIGTPQGPQIKWSSYDPETNDIIEDGFQSGQQELMLTHGVFARGTTGYLINFTQMTQTNSANGASRQIKRMVRKQ